MKTVSRLLALSVLASGAFFTTSAFACSTAAWSSAAAASTAGQPDSSPTVSRIMGKCGLRVTADGFVVDNTPDGEPTFIARFYFFGKNLGAGTHQIFSATSADNGGGNGQFIITYNGTNISVDATAGGGGTFSTAAVADKWNLVEVSWSAGATGSLWVNANATTAAASGTFNSGTGSIGSARLGAVSAVGANTAFFDDYVSHRTLPVGPTLIGDTNKDDKVSGADISGILLEAVPFGAVVQPGSPDCNLDGKVSGADISGVLAAAVPFGAVPCGL